MFIVGYRELEEFTKLRPDTIRPHMAYRGFPQPEGQILVKRSYVYVWNKIKVRKWLKENKDILNKKPGSIPLYKIGSSK